MKVLHEIGDYRIVNPYVDGAKGLATNIYKKSKDDFGVEYWRLVLEVKNTSKAQCTLREIVYKLIAEDKSL